MTTDSKLARRGLLAGLGLALAAPAIIRTPGLLMPGKPLRTPEGLHGFRITDGRILQMRRFSGPGPDESFAELIEFTAPRQAEAGDLAWHSSPNMETFFRVTGCQRRPDGLYRLRARQSLPAVYA